MAPGKVILVTGASRGVGHAIAKYLLELPAQHKLILASRTAAPLREFETAHPDRVGISAGDLSDSDQITKVLTLATSKFGKLDGLVLNHGTLGRVAKISELNLEDWQSCFQTNFFSLALFIRAALPELRKSKGRIIITSSGAAGSGYTGWGPYGASKAAVNHLTLTMRAEEPEVTTIAIRPGMVDTDMQRDIREKHGSNMDKTELEKFTKAHSDGKLVKPEQCGSVIANLAVEAPPELNGKFLAWDDEALKAYQGST